MWFVTQGRFEDAQQQISALDAEKQRLQAEVNRLNSFIAWKSTGVPTHPEIDPRPEWMKTPATAARPEPESEIDPNDLRAQAIRATGSRNPRTIAEWISRHNEANFRQTLFSVPNRTAVPARPGIVATRQEKDDMAAASKDLENALGTDRSA